MIPKGLIISIQGDEESKDFYDFKFIKRMAIAAEQNGAVAVRIEGVENVAHLKRIMY